MLYDVIEIFVFMKWCTFITITVMSESVKIMIYFFNFIIKFLSFSLLLLLYMLRCNKFCIKNEERYIVVGLLDIFVNIR